MSVILSEAECRCARHENQMRIIVTLCFSSIAQDTIFEHQTGLWRLHDVRWQLMYL